LPATEDTQAKVIADTECQKEEMLKLVMEQNTQIKEMEAELERLVKEKEQIEPMEVIPLSVVPLIGVSMVTTSTTATMKLPSTTPMIVLETFEALAK
jgi:hypothetical protein